MLEQLPLTSPLPKVYRKGTEPPDAVYVGRPSVWGNPFVVGRDGTRYDCIAKYEKYLQSNKYLKRRISELRGKNLVCYCAPKACHADVLLRYANQQGPK